LGIKKKEKKTKIKKTAEQKGDDKKILNKIGLKM